MGDSSQSGASRAGVWHAQRSADPWHARRANIEALAALALVVLAVVAVSVAKAGPEVTRTVYGNPRIVPIPASIPHEAGDMVDRRILPDLRWMAEQFPIYVTDGYSGPLPGGGGRAGCDGCHTKNSDHHNGLAVDIVPLGAGTSCDRAWRPITRLARWAEPRQNRPAPPFRWVGYTGDAGHGCGHHLHLSWNHAPAREFHLAEWVEILPPGKVPSTQPTPPVQPGEPPATERGPTGGVPFVQSGGIAPRLKPLLRPKQLRRAHLSYLD